MYDKTRSIKNWALEEQPREKLIHTGKNKLSNAELLAILIGQGIQDASAIDLARQMLNAHKSSLKKLGALGVGELLRQKGIGRAKAVTIVAAFELGRRRQVEPESRKKRIMSSQDAFDNLNSLMGDLQHEEFVALMLNRANHLIRAETISIGGISGTVVDPKVLFKRALDASASSLILAHNHPSGNLQPSEADKSITAKLKRAGDDLEIKVLDHLIIGEGAYYSFADEGML